MAPSLQQQRVKRGLDQGRNKEDRGPGWARPWRREMTELRGSGATFGMLSSKQIIKVTGTRRGSRIGERELGRSRELSDTLLAVCLHMPMGRGPRN